MLGATPPASDHRPQDDALAEEAVPEAADGSEVGRQTFRSGEDAHLARQPGQELAGHGPPTAPGWARERPRLENRRGQELLEAVAVAEREVAARGSAVAAEARALVEHQVGPARGRENRPRGLPAVGMAEELIPAWEHHGDTLALGEAQALVGRPLGPAVADRRLHAGRHCVRREEIGRGRADLERDARPPNDWPAITIFRYPRARCVLNESLFDRVADVREDDGDRPCGVLHGLHVLRTPNNEDIDGEVY